MRKILIFVSFLLIGAGLQAQNDTTRYTMVNGYGFKYNRMKMMNAFIAPSDTVQNKVPGSIAMLNDTFYIKNMVRWEKVTGAASTPGLPPGGTTGQILAKDSDTSYDAIWIDNYTTDVRQQVKAGESINKGQAVYISGADGTNVIVRKASNTSDSLSSKTLGLLFQTLANNGQGFVITEGKLSGLNTTGAVAGDPVWLGTNGNLLYGVANKPSAPAHLVYLGVVTRVSANNGEIFVHVQNGFELEELHDVSIVNKQNGQGIVYESASGLWKNRWVLTDTSTLSNRINLKLNISDTASMLSPYQRTNIYTANGTLTGNRTVTMGGNSLTLSDASSASLVLPLTLLGTNAGATYFRFGRATTTGNLGYIGYVHTGDNNAANSINIGFTGIADRLIVRNDGNIAIGTTTPTAISSYTVITTNANTGSFNEYRGNNTSVFRVGSENSPEARGFLITTGSIPITLSTNNTERMRIFGGGNIGINTTTDAGFRLDVNGTMRVQGSINIPLGNAVNFHSGYRTNGGAYSIQGNTNGPLRFVTSSDNSTIRYFEFGSYASDDSASTWNRRFVINPLTGGVAFGGGLPNASVFMQLIGSISGAALGGFYNAAALEIQNTLTATSNNQKLVGFMVSPTFSAGAFTGVEQYGIVQDNGQNILNRAGGATGIGTTGINATSAILEISSSTRGVLLPRMTTTQRNAIASPARGLMVFDTTGNNLDYYTGTQWVDVLASDFLTVDNTNNRLGINQTNPTRSLHVIGDATISSDVTLALSTATLTVGSTGDASYKASIDGDLRLYGKIRTATPTGGTGPGVWKLGGTATGSVSLNTGQFVEVEIDGTLYRLALVTLN